MLPGILLAGMFMLTIFIQTTLQPAIGPSARRYTWREKRESLARGLSIIFIIVVSIGGIYGGVFVVIFVVKITVFAVRWFDFDPIMRLLKRRRGVRVVGGGGNCTKQT